MAKKSILFIYQNLSSFVKTDLESLESEYNVSQLRFKPVKGLFSTAFEIIKQFKILFFILKYDAVYIWFADYHSLIPVLLFRMFRKKVFVVIGGYDTARITKLNYGVFTSKLRGFFSLMSIKLCSLNFTVSEYIDRKVRFIAPKAKCKRIYNCLNIEDDGIIIEKEKLVLTVGLIDNERKFYIKGIDTYIALAEKIPEYTFLIVGVDQEKILDLFVNLPPNLKIYNKVNHSELSSYYRRAQFYCQLSRIESFGVAVIESIYFGCIPIVTNVGSLPEIVNDNKYVVKRDVDLIANLLSDLDKEESRVYKEKRKQYIEKHFSLEKRKNEIKYWIENTLIKST